MHVLERERERERMTDLNRKGDILKVRLGDDVRRMVLYNTHISYDDLVLMLQRVYDGKLKSSDDVALKYYDEGEVLLSLEIYFRDRGCTKRALLLSCFFSPFVCVCVCVCV